MKPEVYFSIDIESGGPIVGTHSMLSLGACIVGSPERSFYVELQPIGEEFDPKAMEISGLNLETLARTGEPPRKAMDRFRSWVGSEVGDGKAVFVGFNGCYDWQFVNWYLLSFGGENPFGFGGVDIKSYYMGKIGLGWSRSSSSQIRPEYQPDTPQTHNALDDARAQASIFEKLLASQIASSDLNQG